MLYKIQAIINPDITMLNKTSRDLLNIVSVIFSDNLLVISENILPPNNVAHRIQIKSIHIIANADPTLLLKNPPGYLAITIVIVIINNKKLRLLTVENVVKLLKKLGDFKALVVSGKVNTIIKYKKQKTETTIVSNNENPKYCFIYPPGSVL